MQSILFFGPSLIGVSQRIQLSILESAERARDLKAKQLGTGDGYGAGVGELVLNIIT